MGELNGKRSIRRALPVLALCLPWIIAAADLPLSLVGVHAHRYQDFERKAVRCEVYGEIKNTGSRPIKSILLRVSLLDASKKPVHEEDLDLALRVIRPRNAKGDLRPVEPQEFGNFIQDLKACPESWQEGRIKVEIKSFTTP